MKHVSRILLTLVIAVEFCSSAMAADIVFRKGTTARTGGEVKSQTKEELVLMAGPGNKKEEKIPANEIDRVEWDGEPATMKIARSAEERGNLQDALKKYEEVAAETTAQQANLKTDLEFLIARVTAKLAKADPAKADDAIQKLEAYRTAHANSFRYYDVMLLLGEAYLASGDYLKAEPPFNELEQSPWDDYKMASRIAQGRLKLRKDDVASAQKLFEGVAGQPAKTDAEKARQYEARLGVATCLQRQNQFEKAAAELDRIIKEAPASDTKTMGEAYLRKGDNLLYAGQKKDALLAYLHVDVLFSGEKDLHAEALYHLLTLWNEVGQPGRAADARAKLNSDYPNSEWTKKLAGG
jgi:tetratricopeptide (TPR) repeat protein